MPVKKREMSALEVGRLKTPGLHFVGGVGGLALQVTATGGRTWILRVRMGAGKRRDIGLGGFPDVTLAMAREKAREFRETITKGIDPVEQRQAARAALIAQHGAGITFDEAARQFIDAKSAEWSNPKHVAQWAATLNTYASPIVGSLRVADVTLAHVVKILEPIWTTKTETASRVRGRIESVLDWATVRGFRKGDNPARWKGHLDKVLAKPGKVAKVEHHAALPYAEIGAFMLDLAKREGMAARALEVLIHTATRSGEIRLATWDEIDIDGRVWTIPGARMKAKREHRIPLTDVVVELLQSLPRVAGTPLVFPAPRGAALSDMTLTALLKRMAVPVTAHGFRSTFRDWAAERTNYPREVAEMALAHTIGDKVEAAYRRGDLFEKRAQLMAEWSRFCSTVAPAGEVVPLRRANAA